MATILFIPFPETGHLNSSFKIAKSLKSRGHRVYYLGLPDYEESVRSQHLDFICIFKDLFPKGFTDQHMVKRQAETFEAILQEARRRGRSFDPLAELGRVVHEIRPDLFIFDLLLPEMALMAKPTGIPIIFLNTMFYKPWEIPGTTYQSLHDIPELILCPEEFDFPSAKKRELSYYVESSIDRERRDIEFPWHKLSQDKPLIYCSMGSQGHLIKEGLHVLQIMIDAISARSDWQMVLTTGTYFNADDIAAVAPNIVLVEKAPQLEILKRTSIMITHGGFNTVKECILFGVPMIIFPFIRDHPAVAARVVHHGLGLRSNIHDISVASVHSLIDQIDKDPSFRMRIARMREVFKELEESDKAVKIIESILSRSQTEQDERPASKPLPKKSAAS